MHSLRLCFVEMSAHPLAVLVVADPFPLRLWLERQQLLIRWVACPAPLPPWLWLLLWSKQQVSVPLQNLPVFLNSLLPSRKFFCSFCFLYLVGALWCYLLRVGVLAPWPFVPEVESLFQIQGFPSAPGLSHHVVGATQLIGSSVYVGWACRLWASLFLCKH